MPLEALGEERVGGDFFWGRFLLVRRRKSPRKKPKPVISFIIKENPSSHRQTHWHPVTFTTEFFKNWLIFRAIKEEKRDRDRRRDDRDRYGDRRDDRRDDHRDRDYDRYSLVSLSTVKHQFRFQVVFFFIFNYKSFLYLYEALS